MKAREQLLQLAEFLDEDQCVAARLAVLFGIKDLIANPNLRNVRPDKSDTTAKLKKVDISSTAQFDARIDDLCRRLFSNPGRKQSEAVRWAIDKFARFFGIVGKRMPD